MTGDLTFRFASAGTANRLVAGVPAAARLARAFAQARPGAPLVLNIGDGGALTPRTRAAIARLATGASVTLRAAAPERVIAGELLPDAATIAALLAGALPLPPAPADPHRALDAAARNIIRDTAKPGDGIVARRLNRPLSQTASARLLRLAWVRPGHATMLTALAALAMLVCLLAFPTPGGLIAGAVLFQLASVIDGIDGEIARATFRTSKVGASLDSLVDAFTNCAFLGGAGVSFLMQGDDQTALVAAAATVMQMAGLTILGMSAWRRERVVHFDSAKAAVTASIGDTGTILKHLTSRDFYCFALMLATIAGGLDIALAVFAALSFLWLIYVIGSALFAHARR